MLSTVQSSNQRSPAQDLLLPWRIAQNFRPHSALISQVTQRDVLARYRGSYFGCFWSLLRPLAMLTLYTVVFGFIFQSRLGRSATESKLDFTLALFCGLILFDFFSECISRAPTLILCNQNFVIRVVFPLEILPVSIVGAALIQLTVSLIPLLISLLCVHGSIPLTALYLPVILLPLILFTLGASWFLASLGVFIRDINSFVPVGLQIVMFASAIFYSIQRVPARILPFFMLNPIAVVIDQARNALLWGIAPHWLQYISMLGLGLVVLIGSYVFFMRTKSAFADVM